MDDEASVVDVRFETAHDSEGLVVVVLEFPNGARSQLQLDGSGTRDLIEQLGLSTITELIGRRFSEVSGALPGNAE